MSSTPPTEGYCEYHTSVKCHKMFCNNHAVYKKLIIKFPVVFKYAPVCKKHI